MTAIEAMLTNLYTRLKNIGVLSENGADVFARRIGEDARRTFHKR